MILYDLHSPEAIKTTMSLGSKFIYGLRTTMDQIIELKNIASKLKIGYGGEPPKYKAIV